MLRPWKVNLTERIDPSRTTPIYMQIVHALIHEIERGRLTSGMFLPSSRALADILGVNRKTVVLAYEDLIAQGWLESRGRRGTTVSKSLPERKKVAGESSLPSAADALASPNYSYVAPPERPLAVPPGRWLKLDEGSPDGRLFPTEILARAYRSSIHRAARANLFQYRDPRGSPRLRESIASMLKGERGLMVTAENICITRGSQNGIFLASLTLVKPGDTVLVEELTYEPAMAALRALGANLVPIGLDGGGAVVADVERQCRAHRVKAIFLTPHHQFPTTVALRPDRRLRLLELAQQHGFAIIEDDYDHEFHFQSQPLLPMASYAAQHVIYVGSLSKLLLPTLRIGYIAGPPELINAVAHSVSITDGMGNSLTEDAAAELIENGELRRHARKAAQIYAVRRDAFARTLTASFGPAARFRAPDGGLAFWIRFPKQEHLDRIEAKAPELGIQLASSRSYAAREGADRGLRIGFASLTEKEAKAVIGALAAILDG